MSYARASLLTRSVAVVPNRSRQEAQMSNPTPDRATAMRSLMQRYMAATELMAVADDATMSARDRRLASDAAFRIATTRKV